MRKTSIICDMCGKEISQYDKRFEFRHFPIQPIVNIRSMWGNSNVKNRERLVLVCFRNGLETVVEFTSNIHFCSEECMMNWIRLQIKNAVQQIGDSEK